jgi:hypothetical protein
MCGNNITFIVDVSTPMATCSFTREYIARLDLVIPCADFAHVLVELGVPRHVNSPYLHTIQGIHSKYSNKTNLAFLGGLIGLYP